MRLGLHWKITAYVVLAILLFVTLFPYYWMVNTSFKPSLEIYSPTPTLTPIQATLENYALLFERLGFPLLFRNSLIISGTTTVASILLGALAAYALTRLKFRGRKLFGLGIIITYLVPPTVLFIPLFSLFRSLNLTNTLQGLVAADLTLTLPFCTWLMVGYFRSMPRELEEAALVDGCSRIGALLRIVLPLSAPAVAVVALFSFTLSWNEFLYAIVFAQSREVMPLTAGLATMQAQDVTFWGQMMAMSVLTSLPPVALYFFAQRWITSGLAVGGVKG
jgi:multiple sugar transport system permease protein